MTEKQAWLLIAREFEKYTSPEFKNVLNSCGLCGAISIVWPRYLPLSTYFNMKDKIELYLLKRFDNDPTQDQIYIAPYGIINAPLRAKIAREFAEMCND